MTLLLAIIFFLGWAALAYELIYQPGKDDPLKPRDDDVDDITSLLIWKGKGKHD